jgi:hypothetical protein
MILRAQSADEYVLFLWASRAGSHAVACTRRIESPWLSGPSAWHQEVAASAPPVERPRDG